MQFTQPAYLGLAFAAFFLLAASWVGILKRKLPVELCLVSLLAGTVSAGTGLFLQWRWSFEGTLLHCDSSFLTGEQAEAACVLMSGPVYLNAIDVTASKGDTIGQGLSVQVRHGAIKILFGYSGFEWEDKRKKAITKFLGNITGDLPGITLAAKLLAARSHQEIVSLIKPPLPQTGRPSRLVIRSLIPQLQDRFPSAEAVLEDLREKMGG